MFVLILKDHKGDRNFLFPRKENHTGTSKIRGMRVTAIGTNVYESRTIMISNPQPSSEVLNFPVLSSPLGVALNLYKFDLKFFQ